MNESGADETKCKYKFQGPRQIVNKLKHSFISKPMYIPRFLIKNHAKNKIYNFFQFSLYN